MITVFCATNRPESLTRVYAEKIFDILNNELEVPAQFFSLEDFPSEALHTNMYESEEQSSLLAEIQNKYLLPADSFFFVMPEYNGSYPGILKTFIDACSIREYHASFAGKGAALFGVSTGRAGNLRGIDHFSAVLNHVGSIVMPKTIPYGLAEQFLNEYREIEDMDTEKVLMDYCKKFLDFRQVLIQTNSVG